MVSTTVVHSRTRIKGAKSEKRQGPHEFGRISTFLARAQGKLHWQETSVGLPAASGVVKKPRQGEAGASARECSSAGKKDSEKKTTQQKTWTASQCWEAGAGQAKAFAKHWHSAA